MAEKLFYSMGEVAEMFDVNPSLLRHWETQFSVLRPKRNKKGNRLYTPGDVENLKLIYHLVKERGMTLEGARKALREARGSRQVPRDAELMERLQRVRSLLLEVRAELGDDDVPGVIPVDTPEAAPTESVAAQMVAGAEEKASAPRSKPGRKAVVKIEVAADGTEKVAGGDDQAGTRTPGAENPGAKRPATRKPRRKKEEAEIKELFAFYEQSLF